jgi:hypothetical protein
MVYLHSAIYVQKTQNLADSRMGDFISCLAVLNLGVDDADSVLKKRREIPACQIAVFVYRGG